MPGKPWFCYIDEKIQLSMLEDMVHEFEFIEKQVREGWNSESGRASPSRQSSQKRGLDDDDNTTLLCRVSREAESQEKASQFNNESERTDPVSTRSHLETSIDEESSSKFIKSTIPMKIKPARPVVEKLSSSEKFARLNELVEAAPKAFSVINPPKKRVAHTSSSSSSSSGSSKENVRSSQQSTAPTRQIIKKQKTAKSRGKNSGEIAHGFGHVAVHSSSETLPASITAKLGQLMIKQEVLDRPSKKFKKDEKKRSKKLKHEKKARKNDESSSKSDDNKPTPRVQVTPSSTDTKWNPIESMVQPPLKLLLKRATDGSQNYSCTLVSCGSFKVSPL